VISLSLSFSSANRALLQNPIEPPPPAALPFLPSRDTGIRPHSSPASTAIPPPRPNPFGLLLPHLAGITPTPSRPSPEPPELDLAVDSTPPPPPRLIQVRRSHPQLPLVLVRALVSPVRRPFDGNGDASPRPPHLPVVGPVPLSPVVHVHLHSVP
jgi:hypothetical protein